MNLLQEASAQYKAIHQDLRTLNNTDLVCNLLSQTHSIRTLNLATKILKTYQNDLSCLAAADAADLMRIKGVGEVYASRISSAFELSRRIVEPKEMTQIKSSKDAYEVLRPILAHLPHEEFWILLLNRANRVTKRVRISQGGVSETVVDSKIVFKYALQNLSTGIVLAHNHPSDNKKPSEADLRITKRLKSAADLFDIKILDHIIVTKTGYYSFADNGKL